MAQIENLKIIKKNNKGRNQRVYGKYTYWFYQKLSDTFTSTTHINSNVELNLPMIIKLLVLMKENGLKDHLLEHFYMAVSDHFAIYQPDNIKLVINDNLDIEVAVNDYIFN